jgi:hypothetical protein
MNFAVVVVVVVVAAVVFFTHRASWFDFNMTINSQGTFFASSTWILCTYFSLLSHVCIEHVHPSSIIIVAMQCQSCVCVCVCVWCVCFFLILQNSLLGRGGGQGAAFLKILYPVSIIVDWIFLRYFCSKKLLDSRLIDVMYY